MTGHIDEGVALAVAALPELDPQRVAALEHAHTCSQCAALLEQSAELLSVIDAADQPPPVSRSLKTRIERAVWQEPARSPLLYWLLSVLGLASLSLALFDGHFDQPLSAELGLRCLAYELGLGVAPLPVAGLLLKSGLVRVGPVNLVGFTTGCALLGQLLLRARCEAHGAGLHLLAFHVGGVVLAGLLGFAADALLRARLTVK